MKKITLMNVITACPTCGRAVYTEDTVTCYTCTRAGEPRWNAKYDD